jgi:putative DNA primase/helicase
MSKIEELIEQIENEDLKDTLKDLEDYSDLPRLKAAFPEEKSILTTIEAMADKSEQVNEEKLLDENDLPDPAACFQHIDKRHRTFHVVDEEGKGTERLLTYQNGVYKYNGNTLLPTKLQEILQGKFSNHSEREVLGYAKRSKLKKMSEVEGPPWKLNFRNGVLDIKEMELEEHSPDYIFTSQIPYDYKPKEEVGDPERWHNFLDDVLMNSEIQEDKLQEFFGYCLKHWDNDKKKAALLLGDTDSGKGVILNVLKAVIGEENTSRMSLKSIVDTEFGNQQLLGKMVNLNHDLNHHQITNTGEAKRLLEGEDIDINQKGKPRFTRRPKAKHIYSANYPPRDKIDDDAYYNRWLTIRVPETIPKEEQDSQLTEKLVKEKHAILHWAIEGLKRLEDKDEFSNQLGTEKTKQIWRQFGDPLAKFFHYGLEVERGELTKKSTVYEMYEDFCEEIGTEPESKNQFRKYIVNQSKAITDGKKQKAAWGRQHRCYFNLKLKDNAYEKLMSVANGEDL